MPATTSSPLLRRALLLGALALPPVHADETVAAAADTTLDEVKVKGARINNNGDGDLTQVPSLGKTGTPLEDLPASVLVIQRQVLDDQGAISLADTIGNASGISAGGTDGFGISNNFLIRGLLARIYNDGFTQGDERNSVPNSLNGVQRIEILEGPGSALFGSGPPGGSINLVHYAPSPTFHYGASLLGGSYGTLNNSYFLTGPAGVPGLDYRLDALVQHSDGFRGLATSDYELRPVFTWALGRHDLTLSVDARHVFDTPDTAGILYLNGRPIGSVPRDTRYYTPFGHDAQNLAQLNATDAWHVDTLLTVNNRFSWLHHVNHILRNGDGGTVSGTSFTGRQLRRQNDDDDNYDYQLEPVWSFRTGPFSHTLLTGFEAQHQTIATDRSTADLPNIANIFDPVVTETEGSLTFQRDAKHSGAIDQLASTYLGVYATDQAALGRLQLRAGARQDWWDTSLTPTINVPGRLQPNGQPFQAAVTDSRHDAPLSWNVGALYKLPGVSPYVGVSRSHLANFSSEATQNGVAPPESALQYEGGLKISLGSQRFTLTTAAFHIRRSNVFALLGDVPVFSDQDTNGVEADLNLQATSAWQIEANVTSQHAVVTDSPSTPASIGKSPTGVPAHIANLWTSYVFSIAGIQGFQFGGGLNYRDRIYGNALNTNSIPSYVIGNMSLGFKAPRWDAAVGVHNVSDKRYYTDADGGGGLVGEPRTLYAQGAVHF